MQVVVVGAGVSGLGAALALARSGHQVSVIDRDATPYPDTADEAFEWDRRGAPQVRHSHAFLARLRNLLRDHYPDVLGAVLAAGATEMRIGDMLPLTLVDKTAHDGDDELAMIACRRTTFEWVVRGIAMREHGVRILDGWAAVGLTADRADGGRPRVTGVRLARDGDESMVAADLVVAANGRRSAVPDWLTAVGADPVPEETEDTGIVYYSRFYRLLPGAELPPREGPIGGDLGYLKYGVFVGDNRTFSVTLATATDDDELRRRLATEADFDTTAALLPATTAWVRADRAAPITGVHVMAGLLNRRRQFVVDGTPLALGLHVVGDAAVCTNPLYGRGCSTGWWHSHLLAACIREHPDDLVAQALAFDEISEHELLPWYRSAVVQDAQARKVAARILRGEDPDDPDDPNAFVRSLLREGLAPATRTDAVVFRAFFRNFNLLTPPDALMTDQDLIARVMKVWNDRENRPPEPVLGPPRAELVAALG